MRSPQGHQQRAARVVGVVPQPIQKVDGVTQRVGAVFELLELAEFELQSKDGLGAQAPLHAVQDVRVDALCVHLDPRGFQDALLRGKWRGKHSYGKLRLLQRPG